MGEIFTPLDLVIFFATLVGVMAVGLIAGRREKTAEDFFLAGRTIPWWGVAGSIFGSNVSANHMVGMMGIGFSIGFAQSHFELGAIFGLLMLCFGFLPVYRKLNLYTLSDYLGQRYDERSRMAYAVIMVIIMAVVQLVPGLYIGARSICVLAGKVEQVGDGQIVDPTFYALFVVALAAVAAIYTIYGGLKAVVWTDVIQSVLLLAAGIVIAVLTFQQIGGWDAMRALDSAPITGQNKMRLYLPSNHPQLPWTGVLTGLIFMHCFYWGTNQFIVQRALGARRDSEARLGIIAAGFLKLLIPFFAVGTGIAAMYLFRRELPDRQIDPDAAFPELVKLVIPLGTGVIGLISAGLIGAILSSIDSMMNSAATIVTIDVYQRHVNRDASDREMILVGRLSILFFVTVAALMAIFILDPNSEKNFFLQIADYQNYLTPGILVAFILGMFWRRATATGAIVTIIAGVLFSWLTVFVYDNYLGFENQAVYDVVMEQRTLAEIKSTDLPEVMQSMSNAEQAAYLQERQQDLTPLNRFFGARLNFFHRVVVVIMLCMGIHVIVSLLTRPDPEKSRLSWTDLGGHAPRDLSRLMSAILISVIVFAVLGWEMVTHRITPTYAAMTAAAWTLAMYAWHIARRYTWLSASIAESPSGPFRLLTEDRFWAGVLCATAVFMHFYFY